VFPRSSWATYDTYLRLIGERRFAGSANDAAFLKELRFVDDALQLTEEGEAYFVARYVHGDDDVAESYLRAAVLRLPACCTLVRLLAGRGPVGRDRAITALRSHGLSEGLNDRAVGQLLALLNRAGAIRYSKRPGVFEISTDLPSAPLPARDVFIDPDTPYANRMWLRRVLEECGESVWWLDKHFMPSALEVIWEACAPGRVRDVRIISLSLHENTTKRAKGAYRDLKRELHARAISLEWRLIASRKLRATHDRWIIGSKSARNVPNVNAILSGQHSELIRSDQPDVLRSLFERYWQLAASFGESGAAAA
jgi:hypothetical protein